LILDKEHPKIDDDIDLQLNWLGVVGLSPVPPLTTPWEFEDALHRNAAAA